MITSLWQCLVESVDEGGDVGGAGSDDKIMKERAGRPRADDHERADRERAAMDPALVAASETTTDGAVFHFALDPQVARADYAHRKATVP